MCDCAEEQARRLALARKRQQEGTDDASSPGGASGGSPGLTWYSILGGTVLLALSALAIKTGTAKDGWMHSFFVYMGWAKEEPILHPCKVKIDSSKRKWPLDDDQE